MVRKTFGEQMEVNERLLELLQIAGEDLTNPQYLDLREYALMILFRVYQICQDKLKTHEHIFLSH